MHTSTYRVDLASRMAKRTGILKKDCVRLVDAMIEDMVADLKSGKGVHLQNFGKFEYYVRQATKRRVPATGEWLPVPPATRVKFIPCTDVKYGVVALGWEDFITEEQREKKWYKKLMEDGENETDNP